MGVFDVITKRKKDIEKADAELFGKPEPAAVKEEQKKLNIQHGMGAMDADELKRKLDETERFIQSRKAKQPVK